MGAYEKKMQKYFVVSKNIHIFAVSGDIPGEYLKFFTIMENTKNTTTAARMDAATVATTAAAILKKYGTIAEISHHAAALREKYGAPDWSAILKAAKIARADAISAAGDAARDAVFTYRGILGAAFKSLSKDRNFAALCKFARATYKGTDTDAAAHLVRDFYANVDATGAPLVRAAFISKDRRTIYAAFVERAQTDTAAVGVLKAALSGLAKAARDAARAGKDDTTATRENVRAVGVIVGAYNATKDATGVYKPGAPLAAEKSLLGRAVPGDAAALAAVNKVEKDARAAAGAAALAEKESTIKADAAAAGVATSPAPKKPGKKAPTDAEKAAAAARMEKVNMTIEEGRAAAARLAEDTGK